MFSPQQGTVGSGARPIPALLPNQAPQLPGAPAISVLYSNGTTGRLAAGGHRQSRPGGRRRLWAKEGLNKRQFIPRLSYRIWANRQDREHDLRRGKGGTKWSHPAFHSTQKRIFYKYHPTTPFNCQHFLLSLSILIIVHEKKQGLPGRAPHLPPASTPPPPQNNHESVKGSWH